MEPPRRLSSEDVRACRPVYAVWELTLKCDLKCTHCGSRAGKARPHELSTAECLDVVAQLARLGCREITLIGGEAYLRNDWIDIIRAIRAQGMSCTMTTGGRNLTEARVKAAAEAGLQGASVSIDGIGETHDTIRGVPGSFEAALAAIRRLKAHGIMAGSNTQISRRSLDQLPQILDHIIEAGAQAWQVQLTVAMGNAVEHPELLLQPYELLRLMPMLADLYQKGRERGLLIQPGNNIGYFGPYERLWRGGDVGQSHWVGCNAGQNTLGLEADGTIKACPSLPTVDYAGGNIRDLTLEQIWSNAPQLAFTRDRSVDDLWGRCRTCYYADVCRAGCTWTTHVLFGKAGNNPYCHHRALELEKVGRRERVVKVADAPGLPFDYGRFELIEEPIPAPGLEAMPPPPPPAEGLVQLRTNASARVS